MPYNHQEKSFIQLFRGAAPYINAFRGRTFVIMFGGEAAADNNFKRLIHDFAVLNSLGIRLVLVHGARPQISQCLKAASIETRYVDERRITTELSLQCVKSSVGVLRLEIEALLSMGLANSPMAGSRIRVSSGNFVTAMPYGIRNGVDFMYTGEVRRIDSAGIIHQFNEGTVTLLSPLGYSPTGEIFNLSAEDVATAAAVALNADKLLYLADNPTLKDSQGNLIKQLSISQTKQLLSAKDLPSKLMRRILKSAIDVCSNGVKRVHIIDRKHDGGLLQELFTRDGIGTLISANFYDETCQATIDDVVGILELITPLEQEGVLVRRSRERLEMEIDHFTVVKRDGMVIACAALYPLGTNNAAELACLAVHPEYRGDSRGNELLKYIEQNAKQMKILQLYALSTHTSHWFQERGFEHVDIDKLPVQIQSLYNYQRNSKVFYKHLD